MPATGGRQDWEDLSHLDPYWAILSDPRRRNGGWELRTFFERGREEVDALLFQSAGLGHPERWERALDFGCGAGRLTRALCEHFGQCFGLDISAQMIAEAERLNGDIPGCHFMVHDRPNLSDYDANLFDLVLSRLVLQHITSQRVKECYVREFVRVLRPGGLLAFQLPTYIPLLHRVQVRPRAYGVLRRLGVSPETLYRQMRLHPIRMTALPCERVQAVIAAAGGRVLEVCETRASGNVLSADYFATKD